MTEHIAPEIYHKYITVDRKRSPVLYLRLQKALYGLMRASLLFYRKLRKELEEYEFVISPYDPCVTNKDVEDGEQLTTIIIWHIDDLVVSSKLNFKLTKLSCYLAGIYRPKLTMHTKRKRDYLGVDLEFQEDRNLQVSMVNYLTNVIKGIPELIIRKAASPTGDRLFNIRDAMITHLLEEERAVVFHHTTTQLLLMASRARQDIQTAMAFLTTRVKAPDKDGWGKLKQVL